MRQICLSIAFLVSLYGWSQTRNHAPSYVSLEIHSKKDVHQELKPDLFTSYRISTLDAQEVHCTVRVERTSKSMTVRPEVGPLETSSGFEILPQPSLHFSISTNRDCRLKIEFFYASKIEIESTNLKHKTSDCIKPNTIPRTEWRKGLPDPKPGRTPTTVKHGVIHHTAGSNSDTNYVNTIRNIYLFHTQSNGWDDIGYNYVIAQDGTIFEGRDPLGIDDEDNIQGAHFCSKNGGTMGVSLMGDYESASPSDTMLASLKQLLAWKLHKENIDPLDSFLHPNSLGEYLRTVTMHRAGCATLCPGENVANKLADIRSDINKLVDECNDFANLEEPKSSADVAIYPNPASREIHIRLNENLKLSNYEIITPSGQTVQLGFLSKTGIIKLDIPNGLHFLLLHGISGDFYRKKIVVQNH